MLSVAAATLGKYCATEDVVIGIPVNTRNDASKDIIGMFVNTVPVRIRPERAMPLSDYLAAAAGVTRQATRNHRVPFEALTSEFCEERTEARNPIFDMAVNYVHEPEPQREGGVETDCCLFPQQLPWDLCLNIRRRPDGMKILFQYASGLYDAVVMENFLEQFLEGLRRLAHSELTQTGELMALPERQLRQIEGFNQTAFPYESCDIVTLFRRQAAQTPDNDAVVYLDRRYTYAQADEISERIAAHLKRAGIGREDVVSVLIPRCEYMALASLGVLKCAAMYQPLDPSYPPERLDFMISDANAKLLIADRALLDRVPGYHGAVLCLDEIPALPAADVEIEGPKPEDGFVVLYTSGSTGVPKGVVLEHRNLSNFCGWYRIYFELTDQSRVAAYASYGFDACMMDMYPALTTGACVCIVPEEIRLDFPTMQRYFDDNGITHSFMTTQVGRQFADFYSGSTLKHLFVGGETLAPLSVAGKSFAFYNAYGPTECTILATIFQVDRLYARVPIGRPLDNVRLYVVDQAMNLLPPGIPGELLIAGHGVGRGYLNRPEKTAEVFIPNPFTDEEGYERVYRTGDVARWTADGQIDFLGRRDGQVKIRGFRIELSEVEAVIRDYPGIRDATVQAFDAASGGKYLAAYIVGDGSIDIAALKAHIAQRKPPYMVPEAIMQIDAIPLNQNQKVNKKALPKPELTPRREESATVQAPLNILEATLMNIVSNILGTSDFGITESFGALGLTSISSIRLATELYKQYGVQLNVRDLIAGGSIQSVENAILKALLEGRSDAEEMPAEHPSNMTARLSFAQQGVYAECQASPESVRYNLPFVLKFPEGIDAEQLKRAVRTVAEAHAYICCRFVPGADDEIIQEPIPGFTLEIPVRRMSETEFKDYKKAFPRPFDLAAGPCVRFEIVEAEALYLLIDMHHLVSDGASMDIFFNQLCRALDGETIHGEAYTYYDFAARETIVPEAEAFFAEQMAGVEDASQLIPDVFEAGLPHMELSVSVPTDIPKVKAYATSHGLTVAAVYLAAVELTLSRYVCEDMVAIATISNGRSNMKISDTLGMFVNTLPLVMHIDSSEKTEAFLRRVSKGFDQTIAHEDYPLARIAAKYGFHPAVSYAYQVGVLSDYRVQRGPVQLESLETGIAKLPIALFINGTEDAAEIQVSYDAAMYSREMMLGLAQSIENVVRGLMKRSTLSEISLTGPEQWAALDRFNPTWDLDFDRAGTVVSVFKRTAAAWPDKPAAVYRDKSYTYRELDDLTDALAAKLYRRACEAAGKTCLAEEVVAILLPRDENVFILPLAAIKAGLAYEPLDPSYPRERLNFMVKDAGVCLLLADENLLDLMEDYDGDVMTVRELYEAEDSPVAPVAPSPSDLFIMLYTSGSTGQPKGCQIEHRNMVAYAHGVRNDFYTKADRIAAYASFGFDVNMSDVFCTLLNGGTVYLIPEEIRMDLGALAAYFDAVGITALLLTTQVGVQFLLSYPRLKTLRLLVMGGEKLPSVDPSSLSYTIVNGYGPTENCCGVSLFPIRAWELNIPIGRPMATIHGYVLDRTGHRLPAGAAGEYCLSGPQVSRGYLNRPDKTAEAYEDCPFDDFRMYHTGDIVRYRQNGDVEFVGRKDGQVKIRGFRIETKEVESVIRGYEGIRDVTVQAFDYESGGKYLAAYVVSDSPVDPAALGAFIKAQKPAYMVPATIMQIDKIPLTVNQKVDKRALPTPKLQQAAYVAPEGRTEADFCEIFQNALGLERVSAEDDFFDIGGSSVLAMKVVVAAEKAGYAIVYNDVFSHTTPRALARHVQGDAGAQAVAALPTDNADALPEVGPDSYDYRQVHALLSRNTLEAFLKGEPLPLGDVLLTGATGYLGSHVLRALIETTDSRITCLVRPGQGERGEARLKSRLRDYFGTDYAELFGGRIDIIEGDAVDPAALTGYHPASKDMTVINCAASVKHFARGNEIERANVGSVKNLVAWCEANDARLVHISTGSVLGSRKGNLPPMDYRFDEHRLYAGQVIDNNQYVHSKFMAERHIYEEMLNHGLRAKVFRVGNLAPRAADGAFQVNYQTNNYMNVLRAYQTLGLIPYDALDTPTEFSPIDCLATAVLALSRTPEDCVCFMPLNPHRPLMGDVMSALNGAGHSIRGAETEAFGEALRQALSDEDRRATVTPLVAYASNDGLQEMGIECADISHTTHILSRLGFVWPETGEAYIRQFIDRLEEKAFFREDCPR